MHNYNLNHDAHSQSKQKPQIYRHEHASTCYNCTKVLADNMKTLILT